jgi:hypothetical protein
MRVGDKGLHGGDGVDGVWGGVCHREGGRGIREGGGDAENAMNLHSDATAFKNPQIRFRTCRRRAVCNGGGGGGGGGRVCKQGSCCGNR